MSISSLKFKFHLLLVSYSVLIFTDHLLLVSYSIQVSCPSWYLCLSESLHAEVLLFILKQSSTSVKHDQAVQETYRYYILSIQMFHIGTYLHIVFSPRPLVARMQSRRPFDFMPPPVSYLSRCLWVWHLAKVNKNLWVGTPLGQPVQMWRHICL